jgi:hypothetical protein
MGDFDTLERLEQKGGRGQRYRRPDEEGEVKTKQHGVGQYF